MRLDRRSLLLGVGALAIAPAALLLPKRDEYVWLCVKSGLVNFGKTQTLADIVWSEDSGSAKRGDLLLFNPKEPFICDGCTGKLVLMRGPAEWKDELGRELYHGATVNLVVATTAKARKARQGWDDD